MADTRVDVASVLLYGQPVGHLESAKGTHRFELTEEYRQTHRRPVLGQVFEERPHHQWRQAMRMPQWFSNLLPESKLRDLIAAEHGTSSANEFRLLMPVGSDLPGAVEVIPESPHFHTRESRLDNDSDPMIRFSLAGVQLKLSMIWSGQTLVLPGVGDLSDHLVKLPPREFDGVTEKEFAMMTWAKRAGIEIPECEVVSSDNLGPLPSGFRLLIGIKVYVVQRFDRAPPASDTDRRMHMEDLN